MTTDLFARYAELDPAADQDAMPVWADIDTRIAAAIDGKTVPARAQESTGVTVIGRRRTGLAVAALAFAAVILVIGAMFVINAARDDVDPADTPTTTLDTAPSTTAVAPTTTVVSATTSAPPTTVAAPTEVTASQTAMAEGLVTVLNGEGFDEVLSAFTPDSVIDLPRGFTNFETDGSLGQGVEEHRRGMVEWMEQTHAFERVLNARWDLEGCDPRPEGMIRCALTYSDAFTEIHGRTWGFIAFINGEEGAVTNYRLVHDDGIAATTAWRDYITWMADSHPDDVEIAGVRRQDGWFPLFSQASAIVILSRLEEYAATLTG